MLLGCDTTKIVTNPVEELQIVYIKTMIMDKKVVHLISTDGKNFKVMGEQPVTGTSNDTSYSPVKTVKVVKP